MNTPEQPTAADINAMQLANSIAASFIEGDADMKAVCADEIATLIREHVARETADLLHQLGSLRLICGTTDANKFETVVDRKIAEIDDLRAQLAKVEHDARNAAMESAAKDAELAELRQDKDRLDWLSDLNNNVGQVLLPAECVRANLHDMRAAIDAARTQEIDRDHAAQLKEDLSEESNQRMADLNAARQQKGGK